MKTLIIHPSDRSTDFLSIIYANIRNKTVIKDGITKSELNKLIESHDRILMLGHGAPFGLLNSGHFPGAGLFIVDGSMATVLKNKSNCMYIWCYADKFVAENGLTGLCTGMFISEASEAGYYGFKNIDVDLIEQSNKGFAGIISKYIDEPMEIMHQKLLNEYGLLARTNSISRFNQKRLYLTSLGSINNHRKATLLKNYFIWI